MDEHDQDRSPEENLLRRRITGEKPLPEDQDMLRANTNLGKRAEENDAVLRHLDALGETERGALLEEGRALGPASAQRFRAPWALAAAAALVVAGGVWSLTSKPDLPSDPQVTILSDEDLRLDSPLGTVDEFNSFRWSGELPSGGAYRLRIWLASDTAEDPPRLTMEDLEQPEWTPAPGELTGLGLNSRDIRWEVCTLDVFGVVQSRAEGQANSQP